MTIKDEQKNSYKLKQTTAWNELHLPSAHICWSASPTSLRSSINFEEKEKPIALAPGHHRTPHALRPQNVECFIQFSRQSLTSKVSWKIWQLDVGFFRQLEVGFSWRTFRRHPRLELGTMPKLLFGSMVKWKSGMQNTNDFSWWLCRQIIQIHLEGSNPLGLSITILAAEDPIADDP